MNRLNRPELIAAILDLCTLDHTHTQESLDRESTDILRSTLSTMKRAHAKAKADYEEDQARQDTMVPAWFAEEYP